MSEKEDFAPKTYTKQEIDVKTESSHREIPIPDILFGAILEERQKYEKNRRRRINDKTNPFCDMNYVCCSTYGTILVKNDFNPKAISKLMGHATEIITSDVDCIDAVAIELVG